MFLKKASVVEWTRCFSQFCFHLGKKLRKMPEVKMQSMLWPPWSCSFSLFLCYFCDGNSQYQCLVVCIYMWYAPTSWIIKRNVTDHIFNIRSDQCAIIKADMVSALKDILSSFCCIFDVSAPSLMFRNLTQMAGNHDYAWLKPWPCIQFLPLISVG